jgi:hypothetical protein
LQLGVEVFGDDLGKFVGLKNDGAAVLDDGHAVIAVPAETPDQRAVGWGDVDRFEGHAGEFQNPALNQTKRTPWKLDKFDHLSLDQATEIH